MSINFPDTPYENMLWTVDGRAYYVYKNSAWHNVFAQRPMRNRMGNPRMQTSQINGNVAGGANGYYAADQWLLAFNGAGAFSFVRNGAEGGRVLDFTVTTATASPGYALFYTNIEGWQVSDFQWGTASARQAVLSFIFNSSISGQFSIAVRNADNTRSFVWPFTVTPAEASLWIQRTIVIPGDVTGTWLVDQRVGVNIMIAIAASSGSTGAAGWNAGNVIGATGQVNGMGLVSQLFRLTEVSFSLDVTGRGIPQRFQTPALFDNYRQCQRYVEKLGITACGGLPVEPLMAWGFKTMKRVNPGLSIIQGAATGANYGLIAMDGTWGLRENPMATSAVDHVVLADSRM